MSQVLRIGILAPTSISLVNGGVRTQINQTAEALQCLGHEIVWVHSSEDLPAIDILHVFVASSEHWGFLRQFKTRSLISKSKKDSNCFITDIFCSQKNWFNQIQITH